MAKNKIVLNIPHSSIAGITEKNSGWTVNQDFINNSVRCLTDWYTDMLFRCSKSYDASVVFPYSRFCVDVERLLDNDPCDMIGQGVIYTKYNGKNRKLNDDDRVYWLSKYNEHQDKLKKELCENAVLIDCHSFSSDISDVDICIGHNDDWSFDPAIIQIVEEEFTKSGYSVAINKPYSNSITPDCPFKYKSLMIEVNKKVYMDERTLKLNSNPRQWMRWANCLDRIYKRLAECELM